LIPSLITIVFNGLEKALENSPPALYCTSAVLNIAASTCSWAAKTIRFTALVVNVERGFHIAMPQVSVSSLRPHCPSFLALGSAQPE
jgi:hypothetical protein